MMRATGGYNPANVAITGGTVGAGVTGSAARNNTFVLFGDSRTQYNDTITATQWLKRAAGSFNIGNAMAGYPANVIKNSGIGGNTTTQMLARIGTDVLAYAPAWCAPWGGHNDISGGSTAAQVIANLSAIYDILQGAGIRIIAFTETMPSNSATLGAPQKQYIFQLNDWIRRQQLVRPGFYVCDAFKATIDPLTSPAVGKAAYYRDGTGFGVHIGAAGAYAVGLELQKILQTYLPPAPYLVSSVEDCYGISSTNNNINDYGLFGSSGGTAGTGVSGTVANGMTLQRNSGVGTAVASLVARADGIGQNQRFVISGAGASDVFQLGVTGGTAARIVNGGTYVAECELTVTSPVNMRGPRLRTTFTVGGTAYEYADMYPDLSSDSGTPPSANYVVTCRTPPFLVPAGAITVGSGQVFTEFNAGGSGQVDVGRMSFRKIA